MSREIFAGCFIKEEVIKPQLLGGKKEITIRQLTVDEATKVQKLMAEGNQKEAVHYSVKCSMVEPTFFTDEELEKLNTIGQALIFEIYSEIPVIGRTKKEKEDYKKQLETQLNDAVEKIESKEDAEKK